MEKAKKFYGMSNDYMFRAVLQESEETLKHLVGALMHMDVADIRTCRILNPIILGNRLGSKETIMDVRLELNDNSLINIELQMWRKANWIDRSLYYWARNFSHLEKRNDYETVKPTYHIGILNFTLFESEPEFYSEYRIRNIRTGRCYSDKFCIRVLDLTQISLAEKENHTDPELLKWAKIFKAKTMQELENIAGDEEALKEMVSKIKELSEEERIQLQCEAEEIYKWDMKSERQAGREEGLAEGLAEGRREMIANALRQGKTCEDIAEFCGIPLDDVREMERYINQNH